MTSDKYFRRLVNVKKYLILFFVCALEDAYSVAQLVWREKRQEGSRGELQNELKETVRGVTFESDSKKRREYIKSTAGKIEDYSRRG